MDMVAQAQRSQSPSEASDSGEDNQARLLQLLNARCAASLGGSVPVASTSRLQDNEESDSDDDADSSDDGEQDEWAGFAEEPLGAGSPANSKQAVVVSFEDAVRNGKRKFDESDLPPIGQKDGFMVRSLDLQVRDMVVKHANHWWRNYSLQRYAELTWKRGMSPANAKANPGQMLRTEMKSRLRHCSTVALANIP